MPSSSGSQPVILARTAALHCGVDKGLAAALPRALLRRARQEQARPCMRCALLLQLPGAPHRRLDSPKSYLAGTGSSP